MPAAKRARATAPTGATTTCWRGALKHRQGGCSIELATLSLEVPAWVRDQLPGALYTTELQHRRCVSLGRHVLCRALLGQLMPRQRRGLTTLAHCQLVAVVPLQQGGALHLVPYFDNSDTLRLVGFMKLADTLSAESFPGAPASLEE